MRKVSVPVLVAAIGLSGGHCGCAVRYCIVPYDPKESLKNSDFPLGHEPTNPSREISDYFHCHESRGKNCHA